MAKYRIAINYGGGKVEKDFTIPNETGVYTIAFELEDGKTFAYDVEVGDAPNTYEIAGVLTDGTPFSAGTFTTPSLVSQKISHSGGAGSSVYVCAFPDETVEGTKQYTCIANAPSIRFNVYDYIGEDIELLELTYLSTDLLKGSWTNTGPLQRAGRPKTISYNATTGDVYVSRHPEVVYTDVPMQPNAMATFSDITILLTAKYYG